MERVLGIVTLTCLVSSLARLLKKNPYVCVYHILMSLPPNIRSLKELDVMSLCSDVASEKTGQIISAMKINCVGFTHVNQKILTE